MQLFKDIEMSDFRPAALTSSIPIEVWRWGAVFLSFQKDPITNSQLLLAERGLNGTENGKQPFLGVSKCLYSMHLFDKLDTQTNEIIYKNQFYILEIANLELIGQLTGVNLNKARLQRKEKLWPMFCYYNNCSRTNLEAYKGPMDSSTVRDKLFKIIGKHLNFKSSPEYVETLPLTLSVS
ncbi:MAG: hypothetical protein LBT86_00685 [Deltaproteobacteria bacterium]|jgi:hypothetical protein|nr:hypothetical protein [Deltaproteobacteria bacterium]